MGVSFPLTFWAEEGQPLWVASDLIFAEPGGETIFGWQLYLPPPLVQHLCLKHILHSAFLVRSTISGTRHTPGMLETLEQGWWTGALPNSAVPGKSPTRGSPTLNPWWRLSSKPRAVFRAAVSTEASCMLTSSPLWAPPYLFHPRNPTQSHC